MGDFPGNDLKNVSYMFFEAGWRAYIFAPPPSPPNRAVMHDPNPAPIAAPLGTNRHNVNESEENKEIPEK